MWLKRLKFKKLIQIDNIIFLVGIFAFLANLFAIYVLKKEVPILQIIESVCSMILSSFFVLALVVTLMLSWKNRKKWKEEVKNVQLDERFGLGGTFLRIGLSMAIVFGVIYFIVQFLLIPG